MSRSRFIKDRERYKTVLCQKFNRDGECPYRHKCQFAHGIEELRICSTQCQPVKIGTLQKVWVESTSSPAAAAPTPPPLPQPDARLLQHPASLPSLPAATVPMPPPRSALPSVSEVVSSRTPAAPVSHVKHLGHLVCFDSQCHIADQSMRKLCCSESTGQVEANPELPLVRKEASFATQSVLRTVAFVLDDSAGVTCFDDPAGVSGSHHNIWGPLTVPRSSHCSRGKFAPNSGRRM